MFDTAEVHAPADAGSQELVLHTYAETAYLDYAMAVVKDRALAQVQDGNKPVHRRILYAMRQLGLTADAKAVKSARIVGDVLGKYHPHGDSSVYDAMVRLAQPFSLRYPLIAGQGNFGSRDGDAAAAMRYTEAKLSPIAALLLEELGNGTVDFKPNYDGSQKEPALLPARLPFTLLNGSMGIAVGMASNIPPHNVREVVAAAAAILREPELPLEEVLKLMPGPDFPGGGQLISSPTEVENAYRSGRGSLRLRARWVKEDLARGQWQIVVTELPYQVSTRQVLEEIEVLSNPQVAGGKKALTQQQINLKQLALEYLERATDESGKDDAVRLVLVPRNSKVDPEALMAFLLANTGLETTFGVNNTMIGLDGNPATKGLVDVLREWCSFRVQTVRRRSEWELEQAERRIHILEGRMAVYLNLDRVIETIRTADEPLEQLQRDFGLSEAQAADILEMRLRALNKLEGVRIEAELAEQRKLAQRLRTLLSSEVALRDLAGKELAADGAKFGDDRRTLIKPEAKAAGAATLAKAVADEPLTVIISKNLWARSRGGHGVERESIVYKPGDAEGFVLETRSTWPVVLMDNTGRVYSVQASDIPSARGDGAPLTTLIELQAGARIVCALSTNPEHHFLVAGQRGYGFLAKLGQMTASKKAGKAYLTLEPGELPMEPVALGASVAGLLGAGSSDGRLLAFPADEVKALPNGGKGVMLMVLDGDQVLTVLKHLGNEVGQGLTGEMELKGARMPFEIAAAEWPKYEGHRARKGCQMPKKGVWRG